MNEPRDYEPEPDWVIELMAALSAAFLVLCLWIRWHLGR